MTVTRILVELAGLGVKKSFVSDYKLHSPTQGTRVVRLLRQLEELIPDLHTILAT